MNLEIKQRWLDALRSGEYEQGRGCLRTDEGHFCCWGVLQDLFMKEHGETWEDPPTGAGDYCGAKGYPSKHIYDWAGLSMNWKEWLVDVGGNELSLEDHNDRGANFGEIAGAIEREL